MVDLTLSPNPTPRPFTNRFESNIFFDMNINQSTSKPRAKKREKQFWCSHVDCLDRNGKSTKGYVQPSSLKEHEKAAHRMHGWVNGIVCPYRDCRNTYSRFDKLNEHLKISHPEYPRPVKRNVP